MKKKIIESMGALLQTDASGYLINECSLDKIQAPWDRAVEDLKAAYLKHMPDSLHSLYLRGSVPRGRAIEGVSDIDSIAVTLVDPRLLNLTWVKAVREQFRHQHPYATYIELDFVPLEALLKLPGYESYRFLLKVLSVCIDGEDLSVKIRPYKPSRRIGFFFYGNIQEVLQKAEQRIQAASQVEETQYWCAWAMKRLLRTGFSLVMEQEKSFTRDLYPCYQVFSKYHPDKEPEMRQALEWAINPSTDKEKILPFLNGFGFWLVGEARKVFLHGPEETK